MKKKISKLETDVSFLVNRMTECQVITAEFPGLRKDINGSLEVTAQLQKSVAEHGGNMGLVEEHLAVLDRCVRLPGARTEAVAGSARGDGGTGSSRRGLRSALEDPSVAVNLNGECLGTDEILIHRIVHQTRSLNPFQCSDPDFDDYARSRSRKKSALLHLRKSRKQGPKHPGLMVLGATDSRYTEVHSYRC